MKQLQTDSTRMYRDVLLQVLERVVGNRLGYCTRTNIREHRFFRAIDWDALEKKEIDAPFVPNVVSSLEIGQNLSIELIDTNL